MRLTIDTIERTLSQEVEGKKRTLALYTKEAFEAIRDQATGGDLQDQTRRDHWDQRDARRIIRLLCTSLCKAMSRGRIIGVGIEVDKHNREAIESHKLALTSL
jgi:hypothetical protein